jgi:hypothetical protein
MTTWDPDTQQQSPEVFQKIQERFDGRIALDCWVIRGGTIRVGDAVDVVDREGQRPRESDWSRYAPKNPAIVTSSKRLRCRVVAVPPTTAQTWICPAVMLPLPYSVRHSLYNY